MVDLGRGDLLSLPNLFHIFFTMFRFITYSNHRNNVLIKTKQKSELYEPYAADNKL